MVERLRPRTIINYSCMPREIFGPYLNAGMHIVQIPNYSNCAGKGGTVMGGAHIVPAKPNNFTE